jgi:hypothetical protein
MLGDTATVSSQGKRVIFLRAHSHLSKIKDCLLVAGQYADLGSEYAVLHPICRSSAHDSLNNMLSAADLAQN